MFMKKALACLLAAPLIAVFGRAAPPTQESIDTLLVAAKVEKNLDSIAAGMDQQIRRIVEQAIPGEKLTPSDEKALDLLRTRMSALIAREISWAKIKDLYEQVYASAFTQEEIDALIAFYNSPAGQVFSEKQPEIAQKTAAIMQRQMMPVITQLRGAVREVAEQIAAAHEADTEAPPDAAPKPADAPPAMPPGSGSAAPAAPKSN
jgi:uncharacterized protein